MRPVVESAMLWRLFQTTIVAGFAMFCVYAGLGQKTPLAVGVMGGILAWIATLLVGKVIDLLRSRRGAHPRLLSSENSGYSSPALRR